MSSSAGFGFTPFGRKILNVQLEVLDHLVVALDLTLQSSGAGCVERGRGTVYVS